MQTQTMATFVALGLRSLYQADCAAARPTFGWIRTLPLLCDFQIIDNATAAAHASTGRVFVLPELNPISAQLPGGGGSISKELPLAEYASSRGSSGGHCQILARSVSVRADDAPFDVTLSRARALAEECETTNDRHLPVFAALRAELTGKHDPEVTQTLDCINDTEADMEGLSQRGRVMRSFIEEFVAETLGLRTSRLELIQRMGAGFSKRNREPRVRFVFKK